MKVTMISVLLTLVRQLSSFLLFFFFFFFFLFARGSKLINQYILT